MNVGSLFSGIGGIELGFEREGFTTKWFVEWDEYCQAVLRKNFKGAKIYGDIQKINFDELEKVDIITGGFPCQDISIAGQGKGIIEGKRSSLWKHFHRAIGEIRPKYAVIENVSALTFRGLCNVLADLAEIGYDAEWVCLRASDFGALHRRERIFIIAYPDRFGCGSGGDSSEDREPTCDEERKASINSANGKQRKRGISAAINVSIADTFSERRGGRSAVESKEGDGAETQGRADASQENAVANAFGFELREKSRAEERFVTNDWSERIQRFREESLQGGGGFSWCKNVRRVEDLKGRPDIPEPLVRGGHNGIPFRVDRTRACGNAVVPQCAQFIARQIKEAEGRNR